MGQITSVADVKRLGTIMGVWAHPDDETFTSAGIMAAAIGNGQKVICITATKGEGGVQDEARWPRQRLAEIRAQELEAALKVLGVTQHHWLSYKDGCCGEVHNEAVLCICDYIDKYQPDTILTFGPEGMTGHADHKAVCVWSLEAQNRSGGEVSVYHVVQTPDQYNKYLKKLDQKLNIFFNIGEPPLTPEQDCDICFSLPEDLKKLKLSALKAMPSQTEKLLSCSGAAEAFRIEAFTKHMSGL